MVNVGTYPIHGSYGVWNYLVMKPFECKQGGVWEVLGGLENEPPWVFPILQLDFCSTKVIYAATPIGLWPLKSLPFTTFLSKKSPKTIKSLLHSLSLSLYVCALVIHHTSYIPTSGFLFWKHFGSSKSHSIHQTCIKAAQGINQKQFAQTQTNSHLGSTANWREEGRSLRSQSKNQGNKHVLLLNLTYV